MDMNTTEFGIAASEIICEQITEQGIDVDITMPDYCPGITRILKCKVTPGILARSTNGPKLELEGMAEITVIYADAENNICSWTHNAPFSKTVDFPEQVKTPRFTVKMKMGYVNCKAVSEKRLNVHAAIAISVKVISMAQTTVLSNIDGQTVEQHTQFLEASNLVGYTEKNILIEDSVELEQAQPAIQSIIFANAKAVVQSCKMVSNKVILKGELYTDVLYTADQTGELCKLNHALPFSQIMDLEGATEDCVCDATVEVCGFEYKSRTNISGEARSISVSVKILACVSAYCNAPIPVVLDAYSTKYISAAESCDLVWEQMIQRIDEHFLCKKNLEFSENTVGRIGDMWCDTECNTVRIENAELCMSGTVTICLLLFDTSGVPAYFERPVDFTYRYALETVPQDHKCEPQMITIAADCNILGNDKIEAKVDLQIKATLFAKNKCKALTKLSVRDELRHKEDVSVVLYYAKKGEDTWAIAKRYNTSKALISEYNDVGDTVDEKRMLIIPAI